MTHSIRTKHSALVISPMVKFKIRNPMAPQNVDEGGGGGNSEVKKEEDENKEEEKKEDEDKKEEDKDKKEEEGSNEGEPPAGETPVCTAQCGSGHNSQNKILECLSG